MESKKYFGKKEAPNSAALFLSGHLNHSWLKRTIGAWLQARPEAELHIFGVRPDQIGMSEKDLTPHRVLFLLRLGKAELARRYAEALAMIYPGARDETFCLAAAEAQSMGLPVITLGIGSLSERVQNGINGIVCRTHAEMMVHAKRLIADPIGGHNLAKVP
jgi:glycosyltransferase involved in cell wall biosynthesis